MTARLDAIHQRAIEWLVQVQDPAFDRWDEWEVWLSEDPEHANHYWRLAEDDAELLDINPVQSTSPALPRRGRSEASTARRSPRRLWLGAGIAAAILLCCGVFWLTSSPSPGRIETGPGENRSVVLADGTRAHLAGNTRLLLAADRRRVTLEAGRALFEVAPSSERDFTVAVGAAEVVDLGTVFDVTRLESGVRVAVAEGVVRFDEAGQSERLEAGEGLVATAGSITRVNLEPADVSAWRHNRLSYRRERLSVVAEDLSRAIGLPVRTAPSLANRSFTGSLDTSGEPAAVRARLEALMSVDIIDDRGGWSLEPRTSVP